MSYSLIWINLLSVLEIYLINKILSTTHHFQIVIIIVKQGVVDVPVLNINNAGNGMVVGIAVGALNHVAFYTRMRNNRARATFTAWLAVNGSRDVNVALHTYIYAKIIPCGCATHKIIANSTVKLFGVVNFYEVAVRVVNVNLVYPIYAVFGFASLAFPVAVRDVHGPQAGYKRGD